MEPGTVTRLFRTMFAIQASNPKVTRYYDPDEDDLTCAIADAFPALTERVLMRWGHAQIPLSYDELARMSGVIIHMLEALLSKDSGELSIYWFSDIFRAHWELEWRGNQLQIKANWEQVPCSLTPVLQAEIGKITLGVDEFVSEWKLPLETIVKALRCSGVPKGQIHDLDRLELIIERIPGYGELYRSAVGGHKESQG